MEANNGVNQEKNASVKNSKFAFGMAIIAISLLLNVVLFFFLSFITAGEPVYNAQQVFAISYRSVVEVKVQNNAEDVAFGSAVLVSSSENTGYFITNAHVVTYTRMAVVHEFEEHFIRFAFEEEYREVELVRFDRDLDLAILRISNLPTHTQVINMGNSETLSHGDKVFAVGNSQNFGVTISQGVIGIPLIEIHYDELQREVIQAAITITGGNSGGALLDSRGRLIGITTFRIRDQLGQIVFGVAYSIPIHIVNEFVNQ